jgi:hypothetical protein
MRRLLGSCLPALLLVLALGACSDDDESDVAQDPASPSATTSGPSLPDKAGDPEVVDILTATAAGGAVTDPAVPLADDVAVQAFVAQFTGGDLADQVQDAVAGVDAADREQLYGAVVAIGCDAPTDVTVFSSPSGVSIQPVTVPSPKSECFAPMTSVALVLVPTAAAG